MATSDVHTHDHPPAKPSLIFSILGNKCPRCRRGKLFKEKNPYKLKKVLKMNESCLVCGQATEVELGFYYGTSYVSYALAVMISVASFIAWWVLIGFSLHDNRFFVWMGFNVFLLIALQPILMRLSRTIWLSIFVRYSPHWKEGDVVKPERMNEELKNAW
jgi:uncharacterized protein (DUF983 family)